MKYKIRQESNKITQKQDVINKVLSSRGIKEPESWFSMSDEDLFLHFIPPYLLDNIDEAVELLRFACNSRWKICIVVDSDVDGFTSAAIMYNFLTWNWDYYKANPPSYVLHDGKGHGLQDTIDKIPKDTQLVIVPDAGTSDFKEQDALTERGCKVIILDHHQALERNSNEDVVTVNVQLSPRYPNKALTGAGVVWKFVTEYMEWPFTDRWADLCAFGNISDMADYRELEIRAIVKLGFDESRINNPFMKALAEQNAYTLQKYGGYCYRGCAFALTPFVNAICRSGTQDEKDLVFRAMLDINKDALVPSGKRGFKGASVPLAEEAVRVALNVKARQTKEQNQAMEFIENEIQEQGLLSHSVLSVICPSSEVRPEVAGLVANKLQDSYGRPSIVLVDYPEEGVYRGSIRNSEKSAVVDFRQTLESTKLVNYASGHASAAGVEIDYDKYDDFISVLDALVDPTQEKEEIVDFEYVGRNNLNPNVFAAADDMKDCWGQQVSPLKVAVKDISLDGADIVLLSPDRAPTMKITLPNGVQMLKFKSSPEEVESMKGKNLCLTAIGSPSINRYNDNENNQLIIDDYTVEEEWIF